MHSLQEKKNDVGTNCWINSERESFSSVKFTSSNLWLLNISMIYHFYLKWVLCTQSQNALKCSKMKRGSDMQHHVFFQNKKNQKKCF